MAKKFTPILLACFIVALFTSCLKDQEEITARFYDPEDYAVIERTLNLPNDRVSYEIQLAPHMEHFGMATPRLSDTKALLGRVLFYDKKLSRNGAVSCASCHHQELAFSDDVARSKGFDGELTKRNSQALAATANFESSYGGGNFDLATPAGFFWDERAFSIFDQSRQTIEDNIEMGMTMHELTRKLSTVDYYHVLFQKAYGSPAVTEDRILEALQEFVNSFVSSHTRFDKGMNQTLSPLVDFQVFSAQENRGKRIFNDNCSSCHGTDMSNQVERTAHNGLEIQNGDLGVGGITQLEEDKGKFKVPFLRNVALTAPYMHDGRLATLEEVVDHYNEGIEMHPNLDDRLRDGENLDRPIRMNLSENDKSALVAFLRTLTDETLIYDERFSDPFKQ